MPTTHSRKATEMGADEIRVRFSPEVRNTFARLEAAVNGSEHFEPFLLKSLQDLAAGKELTVRQAFMDIAMIVRSANDHVHSGQDNDRDTWFALQELIEDLSEVELSPDQHAFTLVKGPAKRQGR